MELGTHGELNDSGIDAKSTGPLARLFAHSLAPLTRSLALDCLLCSCPLLHSLIRSLAQFTPSLVGKRMIAWLFCLCFFYFRPQGGALIYPPCNTPQNFSPCSSNSKHFCAPMLMLMKKMALPNTLFCHVDQLDFFIGGLTV